MMQTYIGVKMIKAEPGQKDGKDGYFIEYPDGYRSWSPKDVFEAAYLPVGEHGVTRSDVDLLLQEMEAKDIDPGVFLARAILRTGAVYYAAGLATKPLDEIDARLRDNLEFVYAWARNGLNARVEYVSEQDIEPDAVGIEGEA